MAFPSSVLEDLPFCLARVSHSFRRFSDLTLREVGLDAQPPGMATILHALGEAGDCTVGVLVEKTQLPNGTLSGLLDTLERNGYIQRADNPEDGRSWIIRLTREGQRVCAKLRTRHELVMRIFRDVLSKAEAAELQRMLEKLTAQMRAHGPELAVPDSKPLPSPRNRTPVRKR